MAYKIYLRDGGLNTSPTIPPGYTALGSDSGDIKKKVVDTVSDVGGGGYKVYTALLTQSGGDSQSCPNQGLLTIGVTYQIVFNSIGMDFTNVGSPDNNVGTYFVATGTTTTSWGSNEGQDEGTLCYNTGAPVVTVLENTIGNIYWQFQAIGVGIAVLTAGFPVNKTVAFGTGTALGDDNIINFDLTTGPDNIFIYTLSTAGVLISNYGSPIEIRVYN